MGINLAEIQQKVDRMLYNIAEQNRRAYQLFYDPNPMDVELPQIDENGNLITVTIPNRAKIKKQMWDDVNAAVGLWNRTFYVDQINGDDNNPGTSDAPFRTLKKAIDSVPVGGVGYISLLSDYSLSNSSELIRFEEKKIFISGSNKTYNLTINQDIDSYIFYGSGYIIMSNFNTITINFNYDTTRNIFHSSASFWGEANPKLMQVVFTRTNKISLVDNSGTTTIKRLAAYIDLSFIASTVEVNNTNIFLLDCFSIKTARFEASDATLQDAAGTTLSWVDYIGGIVRDANGIPRNVISNIIL